jgi:CubicO group peptidase (beta-lactamase class C family)
VESIRQLAEETNFSGVVRVDRSEGPPFEGAFGSANRTSDAPNTIATRFGIASGAKGLTALTVVSLIEDGSLELSTTARSVLGSDLPLIDDAVTVEHLLAHRSGIGDYCDEELDNDITDYVLPVPVHELDSTEKYLKALDGFPMKFAPGERFSYCNGGYVVLALIAERVAGVPFHELVVDRVCRPAGMANTEFSRSDELPPGSALGYFETKGFRTNVFHLPVRGSGDGGLYTTVGDVHLFWSSFFNGKIVPAAWVEEMTRPRSDAPENDARYGLGFWLHSTSHVVMLEGFDAGVSFWTAADPAGSFTCTVMSNTTMGAWPLANLLKAELTS